MIKYASMVQVTEKGFYEGAVGIVMNYYSEHDKYYVLLAHPVTGTYSNGRFFTVDNLKILPYQLQISYLVY